MLASFNKLSHSSMMLLKKTSVSKCTQKYRGICKCLEISTGTYNGVHRSLEVSISAWRCPQVCRGVDRCRGVEVPGDVHRCVEVSIGV